MQKAQVLLRDDQTVALEQMSRRTGRSRSALIRHGVDLALAETGSTGQYSPAGGSHWKDVWLQAAGVWAERTDLEAVFAGQRRSERGKRFDKQWRGE